MPRRKSIFGLPMQAAADISNNHLLWTFLYISHHSLQLKVRKLMFHPHKSGAHLASRHWPWHLPRLAHCIGAETFVPHLGRSALVDLDGPQYPVAPESKCEKGKGLKRIKDGTSKCRPNCQDRAVFQNNPKQYSLSLSISAFVSVSSNSNQKLHFYVSEWRPNGRSHFITFKHVLCHLHIHEDLPKLLSKVSNIASALSVRLGQSTLHNHMRRHDEHSWIMNHKLM